MARRAAQEQRALRRPRPFTEQAGEPAGAAALRGLSAPAAGEGALRAERLGHRLDQIRVASLREAASPPSRLPLPENLRARMERAFRRDFSRVRLRLTEEPRQIGARALTRGEEIAMAPRYFRPETVEGQRLIGHELAHVAQQRAERAAWRGAGAGGTVFDSPPLEAEAEHQAEQAVRGEPVGRLRQPVSQSSAPGGWQAPAATVSPGQASPAQPGWELVQLGTRQVRKNLSDNGDGTFTLSKTGETFSDSGAKHATGARVLAATAPAASSSAPISAPSLGSSAHDPKNVLFRVAASGKVEYLPNTASNRASHPGQFLESAPADFARFKNAGKRSGSSKVQDPVTLQRYSFDEPGGQFYDWDKAKPNRRGKPVSTASSSTGTSANQDLIDRLTAGELVDRRRADQTGLGLSPFDVGPYTSGVTLSGQTYPKLSGIPAWGLKGSDVNRDHVPSGESLKQRGDSGAYPHGITIAIPNPEIHQPFSPTFGSDNSPSASGAVDTYKSKKQKRVLFDRDYPAAAAYRDTSFALSRTAGLDLSTHHPDLDLSKPENRLRQIGGYRKLNRLNAKLHAQVDSRRGIDLTAPGISFTHTARKKAAKRRQVGSFDYADEPGKTQGDLLADAYHDELTKTKRARRI